MRALSVLFGAIVLGVAATGGLAVVACTSTQTPAAVEEDNCTVVPAHAAATYPWHLSLIQASSSRQRRASSQLEELSVWQGSRKRGVASKSSDHVPPLTAATGLWDSMTYRSVFVIITACILLRLCFWQYANSCKLQKGVATPGALGSVFAKHESGDTSTERLCLLDNAKVFAQFLVVFNHYLYYTASGEYVDSATLLSGSSASLEVIMRAIGMVMMPLICFISGVCSQGAATPSKQQRYVQFLVFPTIFWVLFTKPVIVDVLMTMKPEMLWRRLQAFALMKAFHEEWFLQALVMWRGSCYLLWSHIHPAGALLGMLLVSCVGGYFNLSGGPAWFLKLSEALGFLPYFAIGYVFPFQAVCHAIPRPKNSISILVAAAVVAWVTFVVPWCFPGHLPDGHGSYHCCAAGHAFSEAAAWDVRLYWTRRLAKVLVEAPAMCAVLFFVLPRGPTPLTWVGPHTLYPFLFHLLAHNWRSRLLTKLPMPLVTSLWGHLLVLAIQVPYCLAVIVFFASSYWRRLFGWCLHPTWLSPVLKAHAEKQVSSTDKEDPR